MPAKGTGEPPFHRAIRRVVMGPDGCWIWTGALRWGYGSIGGSRSVWGTRYVHRVVWEEYHGPVPDGFEVHHLCGEKRCCNPSHFGLIDISAHRAHHNRTRILSRTLRD
jgi:hypothetical protein